MHYSALNNDTRPTHPRHSGLGVMYYFTYSSPHVKHSIFISDIFELTLVHIQIKILEERNLHLLERLALQDKSVERRAEGIALADEVVKQYRREGQFFDEILGGV